MLEQLRSAGDHLHAAWETYIRVCSALQSYQIQRDPLDKNVPSEFSSMLDTQLAFIASYESKIQEIKVTIRRARNYSLGLAPINSLPAEILSGIFQLVSPQRCDLHELSSDKKHYPTYPENLTHVCSLWRRIAISCCSLWCHIDLTSYEPYYNALVERAETHSARAGQLPIELHVVDDVHSHIKRLPPGYDQLDKFISRISARVKTLNLFLENNVWGFLCSVFDTVLLNQHPILTKLIVRTENYPSASIYASTYTSSPPDIEDQDILLDLTEDQIESSFSPLTALHLAGIFPSWSSTAYHGLVDLRLSSPDGRSSVEEAQLISILTSSPGLRIFHFGLLIGSTTDEVMPVYLQDLQVVKIFLNIRSSGYTCPSKVFRLLAPGPRPVCLSLGGSALDSLLFEWELEKFTDRSTVTSFHTCSVLPPMRILLRDHNIEHVIFDNQEKSSWRGFEFHPPYWQLLEMGWPPLQSLHLTRSSISEYDLCRLLEYCPTGIVLYSCHVYRDEGPEFTEFDAQALADAFPTIKNYDHPPYPLDDPTADWDHLD
ncbi:unnamed protein product [Rhizoctonia solani]|uniref:F-box-like domain protein n=1 Tax=Rhizoctonia solani TaxID=456999 RepID=A0A8H2WH05_9AGAM|nr:unnamed protein product [Rhizoctonia solani]